MDWDELAEQFTLWLQQATQESRTLAEAVKQLRRGQAVALAAWWAHLTSCSTAANIRRPSLMTTVALEPTMTTLTM